jgi:hypothetical protein
MFTKEVDLCAAFIAAIPRGWQAYAETCGWDILLVRLADGYQVGVQAKLKLNARVLIQAAEGYWDGGVGPDFRAVLVPADCNDELASLGAHCGITVVRFRLKNPDWGRAPQIHPQLPEESAHYHLDREWHEQCPTKRHTLPEYVPDVQAGAPAPLRLTRWKIAAMKLAVLLAETGHLTREDFKRVGMDIRRWIDGGAWLRPGPAGFVPGPHLPDFRLQHPRVWDEIKAEPSKWQRPEPPLFQGALSA